MAANTGSGLRTMPAPPPNGRSSAVLCLSVVQSRRSCTLTVSKPRSNAFPRMLSARKPSSMRGKSVRMSMWSAMETWRNRKASERFRGLLWRGQAAQTRRGDLGGHRGGLAGALDDRAERIGGLGALGDPVIHTSEIDLHLLGLVGRLIGTELLNRSAS